MQLTYVVLSALSLLNMGVQGATIARALTSKHCSDIQQTQKIVQHRQFHSADFISCPGTDDGNNVRATQASRLSTRDTSAVPNGISVLDKNKNGIQVTPNSDFVKTLQDNINGTSMPQLASPTDSGAPAVEVAANQDQTVSDYSSASSTETSSEPSLPGLTALLQPVTSFLGSINPQLGGSNLGKPISETIPLDSPLGDLIASPSLVSEPGAPTQAMSPAVPRFPSFGSRDDDGDQVEVSKALDVVSSSLESSSTPESNSVAPQAFERFVKQKREDGALESNLAGEPVLRQNIPTDVAQGIVTSRGMDVRFPYHTPRGLAQQKDIALSN